MIRAYLDDRLVFFSGIRHEIPARDAQECSETLSGFVEKFPGVTLVPSHSPELFNWVLEVQTPHLARLYFDVLTNVRS